MTKAMTTSEVGAVLGVSQKKVWRLIGDGKLNAEDVNFGGRRPTYRVDPDELRRFRERVQIIPPQVVRRRRRLQYTAHEIPDYFD